MAGSSSPCPDDNDCLRLPATSAPCIRGAEKKESTGLRLSQPCPPYVTPSSISSFGRRLNGVHTAENKSLKNTGANRFCQSSASPLTVVRGQHFPGRIDLGPIHMLQDVERRGRNETGKAREPAAGQRGKTRQLCIWKPAVDAAHWPD